MAIASGTVLGVYEVRDLIGAGGMGEVYRGHDIKLNRSVALKVLPDHFAQDGDRLARFRREAQVLASLNHSNIGAIYGFEESNGIHALVLEFIDGPTLADRIAQGPIPLDEAIPIARQIADALEAAHAQGIVHRDLKPANIKLRPDGTIKVLDFGLAKALTGDSQSTSGQSLTITSPATQHGVILGTAAYMSPEQARGRPVDKRCDVWAFGGVLFEMLTGRRAFDGDDVSDTLANVLKRDADWSALPADTPANIRRVLRRCLEKDPRRRLHDIADVRLDLEESASDTPAATVSGAGTRGRGLERLAWVLVVAVLAGGFAYLWTREALESPVVRFQIDPPPNHVFGSSTGIGRADGTSGAALSPDGQQLAFVAEAAGRTQLWVRRLDGFSARALEGTDDALMPFWAPDSRAIAFFSGTRLKRVDLGDGSIETICDSQGLPRGGTWGSEGTIVFSVGTPARLSRVSSRGGEVTPLAFTDEHFPRFPAFLPDGRRFIYHGRARAEEPVGLILASTGNDLSPRLVVASESHGVFAPPGLLLFMRGEVLLQQQVDPDRLDPIGQATTVVEQVFMNAGIGRADFTVSSTGVLAYRSASNRSNQFAWVDRSGELLETVGGRGSYRTHDLSPDGTRLVYTDLNQGDLWILDLVRKTASRFTSGRGLETAPVWYPDGSKIAYRINQEGMFEKDVSGTGTEVRILSGPVNGPDQVSPDGKWVLFFKVTARGTQDVYVVPTSGDRTPKPLVESPFPDVEPQFSPNMKWLAYASSETQRNEIYVQPFPPNGKRWQVSNTGGRQPLWRADGKELFFVADDRRFYSVDVIEKGDNFDSGPPGFLFEMRASVFNSRNSYVPSRDGKRFLVNTLLGDDDAPISIVQNWQAGVRE